MRCWQLFALYLVAGCGTDPRFGLTNYASPQQLTDFSICDDRPYTPSPEGFAHRHHRVGARTMSTRYIAQDVVVTPNQPASLSSAFYFHGTGGNGITDEKVDIYVDDCNAWLPVGSALTDAHGAVHVPLPETFSRFGRYGVRHELRGDGTVSDSDLYVLPPGTQLVVLDMDGTLTTSNLEIWRKVYEDLRKRKYVPKPITGARDVVDAWAKKGYVPIYLTARPHWLAPSTREWRTSFEFPEGPIVFAQGFSAVPNHKEKYKVAFLQALVDAGFRLDYAYGNEPSDERAYEKVGVPKERTFMIGAGRFGGYAEHLDWVNTQPDADPL